MVAPVSSGLYGRNDRRAIRGGCRGRSGGAAMAAEVGQGAAAGVARRRAAGDGIPRARCVQALEDALAAYRVVAVVAPAGYGKSTLLRQWACAHVGPVVTLAVQDGLYPAVADALTGGAAAGGSAALADRRPLVVVVDDAHAAPADEVADLVREVLATPDVSLVLASRHDPPPPAHRLRVSGDLTDLRAADLGFTSTEVQALAGADGLPAIADDAAARLVTLTAGWAVAVRLALLSLDPGDPSEQLLALRATDLDIGGYVVEEVVDRLRPPLRDFVLRATTDDVVDPVLAEELAAGGAALLEECVTRGLFLTPERAGGPATYRWNPLFAAHCRAVAARRQPAVALLVHRRVALHRVHDAPVTAVEHALRAHDAPLAAAVLAARWTDLVLADRAADVRALTDRLAALQHGDGELTLAVEVVEALASGATLGPVEGPAPTPARALAVLLTTSDPAEQARAERCVRTHLDQTPETPAATRGLQVFALASAQLERGTGEPVEVLLRDAGALAAAARLPVLDAACRAHQALLLARRGFLVAADGAAVEAIATAAAAGARDMVALVPAHLARAVVALWQGRHRDVGPLLDGVAGLSRHPRYAPVRRVAVALGAAADVVGRLPGAPGRLHDARTHGGAVPPLWGDLLDVLGAVAGGRDVATGPGTDPVVVAWAAAEDAEQGRRVPARTLLGRLGPAPGAVAAARAGLAEALLAQAAGAPGQAHQRLETALADGDAEALVLPFVPSGPVGRALLVDHLAWGTRHGATVRRVLDLGAREPEGPWEELTSREHEVLACLRAGLSSREIAEALIVSVNTVKTHQRGVYRKLGVADRREAVREATARGLLT